ncbi:class I SAM-dependent methyltransferase [Nonomuraea thailandensis]
MARAFPASEFVGWDYHGASVEHARERAEALGLGDRVEFRVGSAQNFGGGPYDLVTTFDALHDMGTRSARRGRCAAGFPTTAPG